MFVNCLFEQGAFEEASLKDCSFKGCSFGETLFKRCIVNQTLIFEDKGRGIIIEGCTVSGLSIDSVRWNAVAFSSCDRVSLRMTNSIVSALTVAGPTNLDLHVARNDGMAISLRGVTGTVSIESATLPLVEVTNGNEIRLLMRDVVLQNLKVTDSTPSVEINAIQTMLFGTDLRQIDLARSTFVGSALVDCVWPDASGQSDWTGRYSPPANMMIQPIADVAGVPEQVRQRIRRDQVLVALEEQSHLSPSTWLIHRIVGATTAHGRNPGRLIAFAYAIALLQGIIGEILLRLGKSAPRAASLGWMDTVRSVLSDVANFVVGAFYQSWGYFSIILSLGNKSSQTLDPILSGFAIVFGVIFLGIFINVIAAQISKNL